MKLPVYNSPVLVLSAASGAGHVRAAEALTTAFTQEGVQAEHIEVLKYTTPLFRKVYSDLYIDLVNKNPGILGWVYDSLDRPWRYQKRRLAFDLLNSGPLLKLLKKASPALALCTHFLPAEILVHLKKKKMIDFPVGIVITDIDAHAMWLYKDIDWYFVACEETKLYLEKLGVRRETIHVTGIPIDPLFAKEIPKKTARQHHGLDPDLFTVLVSAGGFGVGPMELLIRSLDDIRTPVQMVVICGRNTHLREKIQKMQTRHPVKAIGFTKEMDSLMAASDILVGKAGGLTSSEAFARGLILVIVNPVPGQEERNSDHFLEEGIAIRCNNILVLGQKVDTLINDSKRLHWMYSNVRQYGHPHSASDVVSVIINDHRKKEKDGYFL